MKFKVKSNIIKRFAAVAISAAMAIPAFPAFAAPQPSDISGHWAQKALQYYLKNGVINGYNDNTVRPDSLITKAELIRIINAALGFTEKSDRQFSDVKEDAWYANDLLIARKAGYFQGIGDNKAGAEDAVTRQDALTMIARAFKLVEDNSSSELNFKDTGEISNYALNAIKALVKNSYLTGYNDNTIRPKGSISRAEALWMLYRISNGDSTPANPDNTGNTNTNTNTNNNDNTNNNGNDTGGTWEGSGGGGTTDSSTTEYATLKGLDVSDITTKNIFDETTFSASTYSYALTVQSDIYAVLLKPSAASDAQLTVTADTSAYAYGGTTATYTAGEEIAYDTTLGGYVVPLTQTYEGYDSEFVQTATIKVVAPHQKQSTYTVKITRECDTDTYNLFEQKTFDYVEDGTTYPLGYNIYYPADYQTSGKKYPVVLALHGDGQSTGATNYTQPIDMVLKRYQMATIWAKDSESNPDKECIVIAPQENKSYSTFWGYQSQLQLCGRAAYGLLMSELETDSAYVDTSRIYLTGLSLGGMGSYAMLETYPTLFAGAVIVAGAVDFSSQSGENYDSLEMLAPMSGRLYITHAQGDKSVNYDNNYVPITNMLDELGIYYETKTWTAADVFYPQPHFSWTPTYADEEIRDWLFSLTRESATLNSLDVSDITTKNIFDETTFNPLNTEYSVDVQSDIYAVLVKAEAPEGTTLTVTADTDAYAYGGTTATYTAGTEIAYNTDLGGYVVPLTQTYEGYDTQFVQTVYITASAADMDDKTYTVVVTRADDTSTYQLFKQEQLNFTTTDAAEYEIVDTNGNAVELTLDYNIYVPSDYTEEESLPVVLILHGAGQTYNPSTGEEPTDMILKRYQMATVFAKDSEAGTNRCIVIAPQYNTANALDGVLGWGYGNKLSDSGKAAYALLKKTVDKYNADYSKLYIAGCSMGAMGTYAMLENHPYTFAAAIPVCGKVTDDYDYSAISTMSNKLYIAHAQGDQSVDFSNFEKITAGLQDAGIYYESIIYTAQQVFYPQPHFSWVPTFANEEIRNWLFEQENTVD